MKFYLHRVSIKGDQSVSWLEMIYPWVRTMRRAEEIGNSLGYGAVCKTMEVGIIEWLRGYPKGEKP